MKRACFLLALTLGVPLPSADLSTLVQPGWLRYSVEPRFELRRVVGGGGLALLSERYTLPLVLQYGLVEGTEAVLELPGVFHGGAAVTDADTWTASLGALRSSLGLGDMALGFKYRLLEDNGRQPALYLQPLLKLPTGSSSLEAFGRSLAGLESARGSGSGSLDLQAGLILSVYVNPVENYVRLNYALRGGDRRWIQGAEHQLDHGARMELLGGLAMDLGARWSLAAESLAVVTQASQWRVDGVDIQSLQGAQLQSFRAAALAQAGINLVSTTEWYIGPKLGFRLARGFGAALRMEAGLTPDSLPWRAGLELSGAFRPGRLLAGMRRKDADDPEGSSPPVQPGEQERGNLQRYLHLRLRQAEKAAAVPAWEQAADELAKLLELASLDPDFKTRLTELQLRLLAAAETRYQAGLAEMDKGAWPAAARALADLPRYLRGLDPEQPETGAFRERLRAKARELHRLGQDLYIKERTREALDLWTCALLLAPESKDLQRDLARARTKLKAIQKLN